MDAIDALCQAVKDGDQAAADALRDWLDEHFPRTPPRAAEVSPHVATERYKAAMAQLRHWAPGQLEKAAAAYRAGIERVAHG